MIVTDGERAYRFRKLNEPISISETKLRILELLRSGPKDLADAVMEEKKRYVLTSDAFGYIVGAGRPYRGRTTPGMVETFFYPLAEDGELRANIVVGAPDPHGAFMQRARDGHYVGVLGLFLGQFFAFRDFPVMVDTDVRAERLLGENLILLGGPAANTATWEILDQRKIFFDVDNPWAIRGKRDIYGDDNCGLVAKFRNPYSEENWVILLAGVRAVGTKATVIALTNYWEQILSNYRKGKEYYWIVQGFDRNADGHIDFIQVKEYGEIR